MSKSLSDSLKTLMHALAASAEAFLHHTFGERYTTVMLYTLLLAATASLARPILAPETPAPLMPVFTAGFLVRLVIHLLDVRRRRRAGVHVQSYSSGISWSIWSQLRLPASVIHSIVEPLLCLVASLLLSPVDRMLSIWLVFAAMALVIKTMIHHHEAHHEMLDALDDRMSARNRHAAIQQQTNPRPRTPDVPVTMNTPGTPTQARTMPDLFRNLDPALQRLMRNDRPEVQPEPTPTQIRPANSKPDSARPAGRWGVRSTTPSASSSTSPKVTLVRTRPAPAGPLRVTPAMPPGRFGRPERGSAIRPAPQQSETVVPKHWPGTVPTRSEAMSVPTPAEVRNAVQSGVFTPPTSRAIPAEIRSPGGPDPGDPGRGIEENDPIRARIWEEAEKLGFVVEVGGQSGARPLPTASLTLTKGSMSRVVAVAVTPATVGELDNVRKYLESGVARVAVVSPVPERLKEFAQAIHAGLPLEQAMKVGYFAPHEFVEELGRLAHLSQRPSQSSTPKRRIRQGHPDRQPGHSPAPAEHEARDGHA